MTHRSTSLSADGLAEPAGGPLRTPVGGEEGPAGLEWLGLAGLLAGAFVVALDFFLALVTLPSIQRELGSTDAELQLMLAAYATAFAAGLVAGGRLGDIYGRRRLFQVGLGTVVLAALAAFFASTSFAMISARAAQGLASALMQPQIIAMLGLGFTGTRRRHVFAAYALSQAMAGVAGQLSAGLLIELNLGGWGWRTCFVAVLPVAVLAIVLTQFGVRERRGESGSSVDWVGMMLGAGALVWLIWNLTVGRSVLSGGGMLASLACNGALGALFALHQVRLSRLGRSPMLPVHLLGQRRVQLGLACVFLFYLGLMSFYWLFSVRTQQELGLGAAQAGRLFAVYGVAFMVATMASPLVERRMSIRALPLGALLVAVGHATGIAVTQGGFGLAALGVSLGLTGLGIGLVMAPLLATVTAHASAADAGALAGTVGTVQAAANALGTAVIPLAYLSRAQQPGEVVGLGGYSASLLLLAGLAVLLAVLSWRAGRP
jgi:MFS family permease